MLNKFLYNVGNQFQEIQEQNQMMNDELEQLYLDNRNNQQLENHLRNKDIIK